MKNPYLYATAASGYIVALVSVMSYVIRTEAMPENVFAIPIVMLSLLTLSVATMGFLFFYEPVALYLDGQRHEALRFFGKTLGTFALLTAAIGIIVVVIG